MHANIFRSKLKFNECFLTEKRRKHTKKSLHLLNWLQSNRKKRIPFLFVLTWKVFFVAVAYRNNVVHKLNETSVGVKLLFDSQ